MSQFLPSHQLLARSSTNEPDAQIPLVDVNGSPRFVGNLGTASSGRRRDDGDRPVPTPLWRRELADKTTRSPFPSQWFSSRQEPPTRSQATAPGRRRLPSPPLPRRHFPPPAFNAGSHHLCFAPQGPSGPVDRPGRSQEARAGERVRGRQTRHQIFVASIPSPARRARA